MKAVAFAYHNMGIVGLEALKRNGFTIGAVFSHRDDPNEEIWFGSVIQWAEKNNIPCFCPDRVNQPDWVDRIRNFSPDVIFSFYYRSILGKEILNIPKVGAFNLHGSLLPAYRGRCPVNWVLVNGETKTGVTLHYMTEKADAGDVVGQKEVPIEPADTAYILFGKLCREAGTLLDEVLPLILKGDVPRIPQDPERASYFGGRRPEDGRIEWTWPAERIYNLIRAVAEPYPGAFALLPTGENIIIWQAEPKAANAENPAAPGTVEVEGEEIFVRAGSGRLRLLDVETEGVRWNGRAVFDYFKGRKGIILK